MRFGVKIGRVSLFKYLKLNPSFGIKYWAVDGDIRQKASTIPMFWIDK